MPQTTTPATATAAVAAPAHVPFSATPVSAVSETGGVGARVLKIVGW